MKDRIARFIRFGEQVIEGAERGDPDAEDWCIFANLTAISLFVVAAVIIAWIWV